MWQELWKQQLLFNTWVELFSQQISEPRHEISNNVVSATNKGSNQTVRTRSLIRAYASRLKIIWLLNYRPNNISSL